MYCWGSWNRKRWVRRFNFKYSCFPYTGSLFNFNYFDNYSFIHFGVVLNWICYVYIRNIPFVFQEIGRKVNVIIYLRVRWLIEPHMIEFTIFLLFWTKSPHLQTQLQAVLVLSSLYASLISFSSFTFPGASYQIFLLFLPWLPCHFYLIVIEQNEPNGALLSSNTWEILSN